MLVNVCVCVYVCVCVCVLVIPQESCLHFLHDHCKLKAETCSASLIQYYLEIELVNCGLVFVVELWHNLLAVTAVTSNPESSEEQILHNRLLINMTVQSVQQIR